jgi:outer membrane lipoprotein-sorting protein
MSRKSLLSLVFLPVLTLLGTAAGAQTAPKATSPSAPKTAPKTTAPSAQKAVPKLTATQIVDKNVAARGGLQAWRAVQTMTWKGKMDAGAGDSLERSRRIAQGHMAPTSRREFEAMTAASKAETKQVQLPYVLDLKRPRKQRLEIEFAGKTAIQVYDGENGWKLRPYLNRNDVEPFTADELKSEETQVDLDGYLIDYAAKGTKVEVDGVEPVEGRDAYKLKVTLKTGAVQRVWVDAETFLDVKVSGAPRRMDGKMRDVVVYQRDFRTVQGVKVPFVLETAVDGYRDTHKNELESVVVNPKLDDSLFAKPQAK